MTTAEITWTETREEYAVRGTIQQYGKWTHRIKRLVHGDDSQLAERIAAEANNALRSAGLRPDAEVVRRTIYVGAWESAS